MALLLFYRIDYQRTVMYIILFFLSKSIDKTILNRGNRNK